MRFIKLFFLNIIFILLFSFISCATTGGYISTRNTDLYITTNPRSSELLIYDKNENQIYRSLTPVSLNVDDLKGKSPFRVLIRNGPFYEEQEFVLEKKFNSWYLVHIPLIPVAFIGVFGLIFDDPYELSPYGNLNFELKLSEEGLENQRQLQLARESERELREKERQENELRERQRIENLYLEAVRSNNIDRIVNYIIAYRNNRYFNNNSFLDIAKLLSNNQNVNFTQIANDYRADIPNPYNFDRNSIYFISRITLQQWIGRSFLADISNGNSRGSTIIYIQDAYNVNNIGRSISNVYLRYIGTETYTAVSGAITTVPKFNIIYFF